MIDEQPFADLGGRVDLDARQGAVRLRDDASQKVVPPAVQAVRQPVDLACVKTWIAEDNFKIAPGGGITFSRGTNVPPDALEKLSHTYVGAPSDTTTRADRDEAVQGRLKAIGDPQVLLFVAFDHQLVHQDDVAVRHRVNWLHT